MMMPGEIRPRSPHNRRVCHYSHVPQFAVTARLLLSSGS